MKSAFRPFTGTALSAPVTNSTAAGPREVTSPSDVLAMLRRRAVPILGFALAGLAASGYWALRSPRVYQATAVVKVGDARRTMMRGIEGGESENRSATVDPLRSVMELMRTRALLGGIVDAEGLRLGPVGRDMRTLAVSGVQIDSTAPADTLSLAFTDRDVLVRSRAAAVTARYGVPVRIGGVRFTIDSAPGAAEGRVIVASREEAIDLLAKTLRVTARSATNIIDVSYAAPSPGTAQRVVNRLVTSFKASDISTAQEQSRRRRVFLQAQLREADAVLAAAELELSAFRAREQVSSTRDRTASQQSALLALDVRREELLADRRMHQSLLDRLQRPNSGDKGEELRALIASPEMSANPMVAQLAAQLAGYQTQRDSLTTGEWRSSATNPDVVRLDELIAATERRIASAVRSHLASVDARVAALTGLRERSAAELRTLPASESQEARLVARADAGRRTADALREDYRSARMAEEAEVGRVEIVDLARVPYRPVPDYRVVKLALGLSLGLVLGGCAGVALELGDRSVRRREDVEGGMRVPVLAVIPRVQGTLPARKSRLLPAFVSGGPRGDLTATGGRPLAGNLGADASALEAYRLLGHSLAWTSGTAISRVVMVTSATPQEGKSTTAVNLALVYAREGRRTLLIDCDIHRGCLHHVLGVPRDPGLGQLLLGSVTAETAVRTTAVSGLSILPVGQFGPKPSGTLGAERMRTLLTVLGSEYDRIIIDTAPLLAVADPVMLAGIADGVLLVVRAGRTDRRTAEQALRQLTLAGARLAGVVLNDPTGQAARYGEYQYAEVMAGGDKG